MEIAGKIPIAASAGYQRHNLHHQEYSDFKQAVAEKCYICVRLWKRIYGTESDMLAIQPSDNILPLPSIGLKYSVEKAPESCPEAFNVFFSEGEPKPVPDPPLAFYTAIPSRGKTLDNMLET